MLPLTTLRCSGLHPWLRAPSEEAWPALPSGSLWSSTSRPSSELSPFAGTSTSAYSTTSPHLRPFPALMMRRYLTRVSTCPFHLTPVAAATLAVGTLLAKVPAFAVGRCSSVLSAWSTAHPLSGNTLTKPSRSSPNSSSLACHSSQTTTSAAAGLPMSLFRAHCVAKPTTWSRVGAPRAAGRSSTPVPAPRGRGACRPIAAWSSGYVSEGPLSNKTLASPIRARRCPAVPAHLLPNAAPCVLGNGGWIPRRVVSRGGSPLAPASLIMELTLALQCWSRA